MLKQNIEFLGSLFLQMYLPSEYLWSLVGGGEGGGDSVASLPPLMPPYSKVNNASVVEEG